MRHQRGTHAVARAVQPGDGVRGHAHLVQQGDEAARHHRRLFGRLGGHGVAGDQRGHYLAGKDGQRKIPRADAHEDAAAVQAQHVALAGGAGQGLVGETILSLIGVVATEVHRLANFGYAVAHRLVRFLHQQGAELWQACVQRVGGAAQQGGALGQRARAPGGKTRMQAGHGGGRVGGSQHLQGLDSDRGQRLLQRRAHGLHGQVGAAGVGALRAVQVARQRQGAGENGVQRRRQQCFGADGFISQLVHERRVGAVFKQPAHQVGEQVAVLAHGGVDAHRNQPVDDLAVHAVAHAVQALHLERRMGRLRHLHDGGNGAGVVRGELRVDHGGMRDQPGRAGQVADVGVVLVREHRVPGQAAFLSALDLAVPIRALHQPHHEAQVVAPGHGGHLVDDGQRAGLVGLHGQAKALPLREARGDVASQGVDELQRQLQPVALLGIDGQVQVGLRGQLDKAAHARQQFCKHAFVLRVFVAREQRTQLDRDAVGLHRRHRHAPPGNGLQGVGVAGQVALGVALGAGAFTQHVVAEAQAGLGFALAVGLGHGLGDAAAQHELPAQQLDGAHGGRHHRASAQAL